MSMPPPPEPPGQTPPTYSPPPPPPPQQPPAPPAAPPSYPPTAYGQPPVPNVRYAGFWIRFVAALIDGLIVAIPLFIVGIAIGIAVGAGSNGNASTANGASSAASAPLNVLGLVIGFLYLSYFWSTGATPGQRLFGLRVVDAQTMGNITFGKAALRYVGYLVSSWVCAIGLIWAAFDGRKQGWHDKIASTFVIHTT